MINKLVVENLKHRPLRTLLSVVAISIQVTMVLTLVGLGEGMMNEQARRARGVGADIFVRPPASNVITVSANMTSKWVDKIRMQPHVVAATGILLSGTDFLNYVTGIDLAEFNKLNGGFRFKAGGPFEHPDDVMVDSYYADGHNLHVGDHVQLLEHSWRLSGIYEPGMLARLVLPLDSLQDLTANTGKVTTVYVKLDNPERTKAVMADLKQTLRDAKIYSMEEYVGAYSVASVPMLKEFIWVVIGLGVVVGFLVVFLSMYTAVLERTREIGVLKALGASPGYILSVLMRETVLLAVAGSIFGILMAYVTRYLITNVIHGALIQAIVYNWWPITAGLALVGAILGAIYPGLKAARQDAIEALAYD